MPKRVIFQKVYIWWSKKYKFRLGAFYDIMFQRWIISKIPWTLKSFCCCYNCALLGNNYSRLFVGLIFFSKKFLNIICVDICSVQSFWPLTVFKIQEIWRFIPWTFYRELIQISPTNIANKIINPVNKTSRNLIL